MDIRVSGWKYENIRGGLRNLKIDLGSSPARWSLIQMPNGHGKTTTMFLLRAVFTGRKLSPTEVRDLRSNDDAETGLFELHLVIKEKPIRVQLRLNYVDGTYTYWTARSEKLNGGLEEGLLYGPDLTRQLTEGFTNLFVFDGELAKEIRNVDKDRAADAIKVLYRLDSLAELQTQITRLIAEKKSEAAAVSSATELKGYNRANNALIAARERKDGLLQRIAEKQKRRKVLEKEKASIQSKIDKHIEQDSGLRERKVQLDTNRAVLTSSVFEKTTETLAALRVPAKIHERLLQRLHALGSKLTVLKLPKTISAEFFRELAEQDECVCGRKNSEIERKAILERADLYLAEDQISVINKMKLALRETAGDPALFSNFSDDLKSLLDQLQKNKTAYDQLELERIEGGDTELEALRGKFRSVDDEIKRLDVDLEILTTKDKHRHSALGCNENNNLALCTQAINVLDGKVTTITNTRTFAAQGEYLLALIRAVSENALNRLREKIRRSTNEKLKQLVPAQGLEVAKISGALELRSTGLRSKGGVSEGQSLAVAYAFLTSLLTEAPFQLPFIVDSPAVSLDTKVRREVGDLIPNLFGQMIMFVISSERAGFADAFYTRKGVKYLTIFEGAEGLVEMHDGLQFFQQFHEVEAS